MLHRLKLGVLLQWLILLLSSPAYKASSLGLTVHVVPLEVNGGKTVGKIFLSSKRSFIGTVFQQNRPLKLSTDMNDLCPSAKIQVLFQNMYAVLLFLYKLHFNLLSRKESIPVKIMYFSI